MAVKKKAPALPARTATPTATPTAAPTLAERMEEKRDSKRLRLLRQQHPELEIHAAPPELRGRVLELQEELTHAIGEAADAARTAIGLAPGFTFHVSEGVFTRPKKERPAARPTRRP